MTGTLPHVLAHDHAVHAAADDIKTRVRLQEGIADSPAGPDALVTEEAKVYVSNTRDRVNDEEEADKEKEPEKGFVPSLTAAAQAAGKVPDIVQQASAFGSATASLVCEQPSRTFAVVAAVVDAAKQGAEMALKEPDNLQAAVQHVQTAVKKVTDTAQAAPKPAKRAVNEAVEAVQDVAAGVSQPSPGKLGEGGVEAAKATGNAAAVVAKSPRNVLAAAWNGVAAGARGALVPLKHPRKTARSVFQGVRAAGEVAGLALRAPQEMSATATALTGAAQEVGSAVGQTMTAAKMAPGGKLGNGLMTALLLPLVLGAALVGLAFGVANELSGRSLSWLVSFFASALATASRVMAARFPAHAAAVAGPITGPTGPLADPLQPPLSVTSSGELSSMEPGAVVAVQEEVQGQPHTAHGGHMGPREHKAASKIVAARAQSLAFSLARDALFEEHSRVAAAEEEERRRRDHPVTKVANAAAAASQAVGGTVAAAGNAVGGAVAAAGHHTGNALRRLAFWDKKKRRGNKHGSERSRRRSSDGSSLGVDTSRAIHRSGSDSSLSTVHSGSSSDSSSGGVTLAKGLKGAVMTPEGPMLPILALGMPGGPYRLPPFTPPPRRPLRPGAAEAKLASPPVPVTIPVTTTTVTTIATTPVAVKGSATPGTATPPVLERQEDFGPEAVVAAKKAVEEVDQLPATRMPAEDPRVSTVDSTYGETADSGTIAGVGEGHMGGGITNILHHVVPAWLMHDLAGVWHLAQARYHVARWGLAAVYAAMVDTVTTLHAAALPAAHPKSLAQEVDASEAKPTAAEWLDGNEMTHRAQRVVMLLLQPMVLGLASALAALDTLAWRANGMMRLAFGRYVGQH